MEIDPEREYTTDEKILITLLTIEERLKFITYSIVFVALLMIVALIFIWLF
jgi:hypothetical protein